MTVRQRTGLIIAIDGPGGSGKSTTARSLAKALKLPYIDTGAMYRAVTLRAMRGGVDFADKSALVRAARSARIRLVGKDPDHQRVYLDGRDVTKAIRTPELTRNVFYVAQEPRIRKVLVQKQRQMAKEGGAVMEGRDIGTVVFPNADYKFYFAASAEIRALRRYRELRAEGVRTTVAKVRQELIRRDKTDLRRKQGPLKQAKDAIYIDTTPLTIPETVGKIVRLIQIGSSEGKAGSRKRTGRSVVR